MPSLADLTNTVNGDRNAARVRPLMIDSSRATFIRPISLSSYNTNWSISHIPGPPSPSLTSFVLSSFLSTTPTTTITTIVLTEDRYYPFWLLIIVAIIGSIISVLTVLGNILVILAFFLDRQIRQPTNYFILSLSVSDFLIGLLSMPIFTIYIYAREWPLNAIMCDIWLSLDYTVCLTSIYTVLFITIDRFCSVKLPAKYRKWRTRRKINVMIAVTWAGKKSNKIVIDFVMHKFIFFSSNPYFFYIYYALSTFKKHFQYAKWCLYVSKIVLFCFRI